MIIHHLFKLLAKLRLNIPFDLSFLAPEALFIVQDTRYFGVKESILFQLFQLAVSHFEIPYVLLVTFILCIFNVILMCV